jgi:leucyl aminopeptidase
MATAQRCTARAVPPHSLAIKICCSQPNHHLPQTNTDISSTGEPGSAGSITAALFLAEFAKAAPAWLHIDTAGWCARTRWGSQPKLYALC